MPKHVSPEEIELFFPDIQRDSVAPKFKWKPNKKVKPGVYKYWATEGGFYFVAWEAGKVKEVRHGSDYYNSILIIPSTEPAATQPTATQSATD